jgi:hypothetical protein
MDKLLNILRTETTSLKEQFLKMTKTWCEKKYEDLCEKSKWSEKRWCEHFGLTPELKNKHLPTSSFYSFPSGFYNTKDSVTYRRMRDEIRKVFSMGKEKFIEKELKKSEDHYESSLLKLKERILKKGLVIDNMKIVNGSVGVNINMTLSDGEKSVKAFTIVAEGEIQKPHYRYLVK